MNLKKELGFLDVFCIASGAMISSGIFILPSLAFTLSGPAMVFSYFLGGVIAFLGILAVVELTTAMPKAGGDYFFIKRALGPLAGTISGMLSWFAISLKTAFAIYGIGAVLTEFIWNHVYQKTPNSSTVLFIALAAALFFLVLNMVGVDFASKFEVLIVILLLIIMIIYILWGFLGGINWDYFHPFVAQFNPKTGELIKTESFWSVAGIACAATTTGFIFISFGGLLNIASISEEVKNPKRNIVWGLISSILSITIFYTLMILVTVGWLKSGKLAISLTPIADAARGFAGEIGYYGILIASMLAFISTANAGIMSASRYPLAMSRDNLLPKKFGKINHKFRTPIIAICATGIFIAAALVLPLEYLAKTASAVILISYILTNISVIVLRESNVRNYKPSFRVKFYPFLQIIMIIIFFNFVLSLGFLPLLICSTLAGGSFCLYIFYGAKHYKKGDYALLHLLLRITKNINFEHELEGELRDIINEREEVILDYFDNLIKKSKFIELSGPATLCQLFSAESDYLSEELHIDSPTLVKRFQDREDESSTAVSPFTAIPHIVMKETDDFKMLVVRCKNGIYFNDEFQDVKAVFLFVSGGNIAHNHLQVLAAIAAITQTDGFEKDWLEAPNEEYLKDLILLTDRSRF